MTNTTLKEIAEKAIVKKSDDSQPGKGQRNKKPNPDEMKQSWETFLRGLPAELRPKFEMYHQRVISDAINTDQSNPALENLLPEIKTIDAATILRTEYPPIDWIVEDYLAPGLTFIVGKPKVGKSWLALQLTLSVMTGGKMFEKDVKKGRALILALEDNGRRLQDRMKKQSWDAKPGMVDFMLADEFMEKIGALNSGGGKRLLKLIERRKYRVVIVDTFSKSVRGDQNKQEEMTIAVGTLQQYALSKGIALVFLDHMPKNSLSQNPIDHLYGSVAKVGAADALWGIYKEQGKAGAKLAINGRDVPPTELKLMFDTRGFYWHCEGIAQDVEMTMQRKAILDALRDLGMSQVKDIAEAAGQRPNHCRTKLNDLVNAGLVRRVVSKQSNIVLFELVGESNESR